MFDKKLTLKDRVAIYKSRFPNWMHELEVGKEIFGIWQIGNSIKEKRGTTANIRYLIFRRKITF